MSLDVLFDKAPSGKTMHLGYNDQCILNITIVNYAFSNTKCQRSK